MTQLELLWIMYVVMNGIYLFIINKLVNKVMAKSWFDYVDAKKHLEKPKIEYREEEFVPQENMGRMLG